jgi:hypothetical protein
VQRGGVGLASASDTVRAEQHRCRRRCRVSRRDLCGVAQRQFALVPLLKLRDGALEGREELVALQVEPCDLVLVLVAETSAMFRNSCVRVCSTKPLSSERITDCSRLLTPASTRSCARSFSASTRAAAPRHGSLHRHDARCCTRRSGSMIPAGSSVLEGQRAGATCGTADSHRGVGPNWALHCPSLDARSGSWQWASLPWITPPTARAAVGPCCTAVSFDSTRGGWGLPARARG